MNTKKTYALVAAAAAALALSSCGSATTDYMNTSWDAATDQEKRMVCAFFRAEPDEELGMGEEPMARAAVESAAAEGIELDAKEVRKFMDDECPSKAELDKQMQQTVEE